VVYRSPNARLVFLGISELTFGLHWRDPRVVVEPLIRESFRRREYLHPRDVVVLHADRLGVIRDAIVSAAAALPSAASAFSGSSGSTPCAF
jgi:hypothetical protein